MTPNCDLKWSYSKGYGTLFELGCFKKYEKSNRKQSFHYMGPRLYNALPVHLRMFSSSESFDIWKHQFDIFLATIPDNPITGPNESGLCEHITSKQTNSIIFWIPFLGKSGRRGAIDISMHI